MDDKPLDQNPLPDWATVKPIPEKSPWAEPPTSPPPPPIPPQPETEPKITEQPTPPPPPSAFSPKIPESPFGISGILPKLLLGLIGLALIVFLGTRLFSFVKERVAPQPKMVTLTYWGLWEDKNILTSLISDFEREHPNIKIDYQKRDIKQYRETLKARLASGGGPDIFRFHNSWLPMFANDLLPLPKNILGEKPENDFYPVVNQDLKIGGAYFGLPLEIDTLLLFVNSDLLKTAGGTPPKTWKDIQDLSPRLTLKDASGKIKTAGVGLGTYDNINHASDILSLMFAQNGVNLKNIKLNSQSAAEALSFYTSFAKGEGRVWDDSLDPSILAFAKGNLGMFFGFSWDVFIIQAVNPRLNFEILPVPQIDENRKVTLASYWAEGVSKKSKNPKAAFEFLAFLNKKETLQKFYSEAAKGRLFGEPYARVDLAENLADNPYLSPVLNQAKDATSTFFASDTFDNGLNTELNRYLGDAVRATLGNTSPETAVETLIKGVEQVFAKYGIR